MSDQWFQTPDQKWHLHAHNGITLCGFSCPNQTPDTTSAPGEPACVACTNMAAQSLVSTATLARLPPERRAVWPEPGCVIDLSEEAYNKALDLVENLPPPTEKLKSLFRLDMTNVTRFCIACDRPVVTTHTRIPVCIKCREKGLVGRDELAEVCQNLTTARAAADAYYTELKDLETFDCPACFTRITPDDVHHSAACSIAITLALPMEPDE